MKIGKIAQALFAILLLTSCATPKISYFQGVPLETPEQIMSKLEVKVRPDDKLRIVVNSKDEQLMDLLNLRNPGGTTGGNNTVLGYYVRDDGTIDFPVLGNIPVAGLTRDEIAARIKQELIDNNLVKDPVVTVEFLNLTVVVLGEVGSPGRYNIDKERMTLLDALSLAGDITIFGKRDNVLVQRLENGKNVIYKVDVSQGLDLYASPVYYVQQNDVIYVEPNEVKVRQSTVMGNTTRTPTFWLSLVSSTLSVVMTIIAFSKLGN